jgi:anti-anti-sigma factor
MVADRSCQPDGHSTANVLLNYVDGTELFSVIVHQPNPAVVVVHLAGEIDLLAEPSLQDHLSELLVTQPDCLIIDLSQVSFMGATGLSVLVRTRHVAAQQGTILKLCSPSRCVARVLELLGLDRLFEVLPEVTDPA